jgi:hypothetical protein
MIFVASWYSSNRVLIRSEEVPNFSMSALRNPVETRKELGKDDVMVAYKLSSKASSLTASLGPEYWRRRFYGLCMKIGARTGEQRRRSVNPLTYDENRASKSERRSSVLTNVSSCRPISTGLPAKNRQEPRTLDFDIFFLSQPTKNCTNGKHGPRLNSTIVRGWVIWIKAIPDFVLTSRFPTEPKGPVEVAFAFL